MTKGKMVLELLMYAKSAKKKFRLIRGLLGKSHDHNVNWCRGFLRIQCYSTCQAANFAATTSCTFGGLFWSTTLTCAQIFPVLSANATG